MFPRSRASFLFALPISYRLLLCVVVVNGTLVRVLGSSCGLFFFLPSSSSWLVRVLPFLGLPRPVCRCCWSLFLVAPCASAKRFRGGSDGASVLVSCSCACCRPCAPFLLRSPYNIHLLVLVSKLTCFLCEGSKLTACRPNSKITLTTTLPTARSAYRTTARRRFQHHAPHTTYV